MTNFSLRIAPIALAALLCAPVAAVAQTETSPGTASGAGAPAGAAAPTAPATPSIPPTTAAPANNGGNSANESSQMRVDQRINQLHAEMHITQAQEGQWRKFSQVMRNNARTMQGALMQRADQFDKLNAVQNLESYAKLARLHADDVKKLASAFESLYNTLPSEQRQLADQVFRAKAESRAQQHAGATPSTAAGTH